MYGERRARRSGMGLEHVQKPKSANTCEKMRSQGLQFTASQRSCELLPVGDEGCCLKALPLSDEATGKTVKWPNGQI